MLIKLLNAKELLEIKKTIDTEITSLGDFDSGLIVALEVGYLYITDQLQRLTAHAEPSYYGEELYVLSSKQSTLIKDYFTEKLEQREVI